MHKLLAGHDVKAEHFVDEPCVDFVQPSAATAALMSKPPGHSILVHLTSDSATLKTVSYSFMLQANIDIFMPRLQPT